MPTRQPRRSRPSTCCMNTSMALVRTEEREARSEDRAPSHTQGRLCIVLAALLWSTGGAFTKILTQDTFANVHEPVLDTWAIGTYRLPVQIACYRVLFAGLVLLPTLRRRDITFRPAMLW